MEIISRKEAKEKGLKRYFTGKPCPNGHISERLVSNHGCIRCNLENNSKRYFINRYGKVPEKEVIKDGYKRCATCNEIKPLLNFKKTKGGYRGVAGTCKTCTSIKVKQYQDTPQWRINYYEYQWKKLPIEHKYRPDFQHICIQCGEEFLIDGTPKGYKKALCCSIHESYEYPRKTCSKSCNDALAFQTTYKYRIKERYKNDSEYRNKILKVQSEYTKLPRVRKKIRETARVYRKENKEKINTYQTNWASDKRKTDLSFKMMELLRKRVLGLLKQNGFYKEESSLELLGADVLFVQEHLESQFEDGMSWDNWTPNGWHLDHIRPCATFDLSDTNQQKVCFNWRNLQPLWSHINTSKRNLYRKSNEQIWIKRMRDLGYEGELFLKFPT